MIPEHMSAGQFPAELEGGEQFRGGPPVEEPEFFGPCPSWQHLCEGADRVTDEYSFTLYAFDKKKQNPPAPVEGEPYLLALAAYLEDNAIAMTELTATSDAAPSEFPACPMDDLDAGAMDGGMMDGGMSMDAGDMTDMDAGDMMDMDAGDAG